MTDREELLASLHDHLAATEERPLETAANRWLGEAQAVAADLATADLDDETVRKRTEKVLDLLSEVDGTGDETADEHVEAARRAAERVLDQ
ncbi:MULTISPECIES: hypothetical protein [Salinibaculum]|uniref:hypothetical protein n=1 Tax=Salinibaculum TaxID=2732368 RepID=UPI0030CB5595